MKVNFIKSLFRGFALPIYKRSARQMARELSSYIHKDDEVLDLGCGIGIISYFIGKDLGAKVMGVDIRDVREFKIPFVIYNGQSLPFSDKSFDVILIAYVLHHVDNVEIILEEAKRICRGKIIIYEDTPENLIHQFFYWFHRLGFKILFKSSSLNARFLSPSEWIAVFHKLNLKITSIEKVKPFHPLYFTKRLRFTLSI